MKRIICKFLLLLIILNVCEAQNEIPIVKWKFQTDAPIRSAAVLDQGRLYFCNSAGETFCIDQLSGELIWRIETDAAITASPCVSGSIVLASNRDNILFALNRLTGEKEWQYEMGQTLQTKYNGWDYFSASPVAQDGVVYVGSGDGYLYAILIKNGKLLWKYKTEGRIRATPLIHEELIYQPSNDGVVYAIDIGKGKLVSKFETKGASYDEEKFGFNRNGITDRPSIKNDMFIIGAQDGNVYGLDLKTLKPLWDFSYGSTWAMNSTVDGDNVFVGWSTNDKFCAIDRNTGQEIWQYKCGSHVYTKPLVVGENVYIGCADGLLYCFNKNSGERIWTYDIGRELYSSPIYDQDMFYFGSDDGALYAMTKSIVPHKTVFLPDSIRNRKGLRAVRGNRLELCNYLVSKQYERLDSASLFGFLTRRIEDKEPSVIVFTLSSIPKNIVGENPKTGLIRQYLDTGGKIVWADRVANTTTWNGEERPVRDVSISNAFLSISYDDLGESGNYYSEATQEGENWGLPHGLKSTNFIVKQSEEITPLAIDEFGRTSIWNKQFHDRQGSGFVSCRTWAWNVPIKEQDMEIIHRLAIYGLE